MSFVEIFVSLIVMTLILSLTIVQFGRLLDVKLDRDIIETAVYAGLWKTELIKIYIGKVCYVTDLKTATIQRPSEWYLSGLNVFPFSKVNGGTYGNGYTIEPIMFKVGGR